MMDRGQEINRQFSLMEEEQFTGWRNQPIVAALNESVVLDNLNKVQRSNLIAPPTIGRPL